MTKLQAIKFFIVISHQFATRSSAQDYQILEKAIQHEKIDLSISFTVIMQKYSFCLYKGVRKFEQI